MIEHIDFYRSRRAKPGKGARKAELLLRYRELEGEITHYIIAGCAGNKDSASKRGAAEAERMLVSIELEAITKV